MPTDQKIIDTFHEESEYAPLDQPDHDGTIVMQEDHQIIPGDGLRPTIFRKKVTKQTESSNVRKVKVPVVTRKVVPTTFQKRVKCTKQVEVPDFEEVEETYTVFEEVEAERQKKVWKQVTVMEDYMKKVPVVKTRIVKKPVTRIEHVDDFQMVTVPGTKVVEVEGFRIDEVEDRKMVEVEEWEVYELLPHHTGRRVKGETRVIGAVASEEYTNRTAGSKVYIKGSREFTKSGIDFDSIPTDFNEANKVTYSGYSKRAESSQPSTTTRTTKTTRSRKKKQTSNTEEF